MHFLGVPTTRAAALVTSDSLTQRGRYLSPSSLFSLPLSISDMFYNDNDMINDRCFVMVRLTYTLPPSLPPAPPDSSYNANATNESPADV